MKYRFLLLCIVTVIGCGTPKPAGKSAATGQQEASKNYDYRSDSSLPLCIKDLIEQFRREEVQNPPRSVYRYTYRMRTVFYVPPLCCDFFSDLYDTDCKLIAHPDGGYTGRGDGTATDFINTRINGKLIWQDERK